MAASGSQVLETLLCRTGSATSLQILLGPQSTGKLGRIVAQLELSPNTLGHESPGQFCMSIGLAPPAACTAKWLGLS